MSDVAIGPDGTIRTSGATAQMLARLAGKYRLLVNAPGVLVLRRADEAQYRRVLMAGEVIDKMTVLEVINVIASNNWRGDLHVFGPGSHRMLTFDQAALKGAQSSENTDRLGEVLYQLGVLDEAMRDELLAEVTHERRLGQVLVEQGHVKSDELFTYLQKQAEQIFYNALVVSDGTYVFGVSDDESPPATTLHMPVQALLMEGVQRIDEMALFRARIPSMDLCPVIQEGAFDKRHSQPGLARVLMYCNGERSLEEIARISGLGRFEATKAIYHMLQRGLVTLQSSRTLDEGAVRRLVSKFNDVMRDVFVAVATYGGVSQTRHTLATWIQGSGYAPYFGDTVDEDGSIDPAFVTRALRGVETDNPVEALHQALHELAAFALFAATTSLPRDQELALSRDVNRRLKAIRIE